MLSLIVYVTLELSRLWLLLNNFIFLKCISTSFLSCFHTLLVNVFLNVNSIGRMNLADSTLDSTRGRSGTTRVGMSVMGGFKTTGWE